MRSYEWDLMQYDWCPYKQRSQGHKGRLRETLEEDSLLQANERVCPWWIHIDVWQNQYNIV